jgi:hypothetical protein
MLVAFTPRARAALLRIGQRWKDKARQPEVFENDITIVLGRIALAPTAGFRAKSTNRRVVFRVGTEKTKLHLYYVVDASKSVVTVIHVWSQLRARPPRL